MYSVNQQSIPVLKEWPYLGDVLWDSEAQSHMAIRARYFKGCHLCKLCEPSYCCGSVDPAGPWWAGLVPGLTAGPTTTSAGVLVGRAGSWIHCKACPQLLRVLWAGFSLFLSAGCEPWPRNTGRQRSQRDTPTGANRLWGKFQNCVQQYWHYQGRLRWQKYLLLVSQFLGSISTCFCLLGWCFKITKWVPFTYGPCAFQYGVFALILGSSEFTCEPLESRFFCSLLFYSFPGLISCWLSKTCVLGTHLSCVGSKAWSGWWEAHISCFLGGRPIPLCSLPILDCVAGVWFFSWWDQFSASATHWMLSFTLYFGGSVHPVFRTLSEGITLYVVVDLLCAWEEMS